MHDVRLRRRNDDFGEVRISSSSPQIEEIVELFFILKVFLTIFQSLSFNSYLVLRATLP